MLVLYKYLLQIFYSLWIFLFLICSTPKQSKYVTFLVYEYNAIQWVPIESYSSRYILYALSLILDKLFLEYTPLNLGSFSVRLNCSFPYLIIPLPANRLLNKLAPKVPNNITKNPPFCPFPLFLIVSIRPFIDKPESSRDLTI